MSQRLLFACVAAGTVALAFATGCDTEAFCFADCGEGASASNGTASGGNDSTGSFNAGGSTGAFTTGSGMGGMGPCTPTNGGLEICDGLDNDCNSVVDDIPGIDYDAVETCGLCSNNCLNKLQFMENITCTPSPMPGQTPGTCNGDCIQDYYDFDMNPDDCETFCQQTSPSDTVCNNKDDDCDGTVDDDVDLCTTTDCGSCGNICVVANGTPSCVKLDMDPTCNANNMQCQIGGCSAGWVDLDLQYATGCEYACTPTGPELCGDQIDNDCDGLVDGLDDLSMDPAIGQPCFGDPDGICALATHEGITACVNGAVACTGPDVLFEGDVLETCNNLDDDCDGITDDNPSDVGGACGTSNNYPCTFGTWQCVGGALDCAGDINPGVEICNGVDDDCDGQIDLQNGSAPSDSVGACNVPIPPPANPPGTTSPCVAGTKACVGGVVSCLGSVGPTAVTDQCGDDSNCDGTLNNQPNFLTDVTHCGNCNTNCQTGSVNAIWACVNGGCQFQGCLPGWVDLNNDQQCEYACTFVSAQEACNGQDDDCDGQIDENVLAPSPVQVCGVSPAATRPECTSQVQVTCNAGNWQCTFPAGVCGPSCALATETCDGLDNDCDGFMNENVADYGQPCASDDGLTPGHGKCRTVGTKVCLNATTTTCSATKADCNLLPGGCTELCDDVDNDCDGLVDETFNNKGTVTAHFYRPKVVRISSAPNVWTYQYEASRPDATNVVPGTGNGYWTSAPLGNTLDKTVSCSEPTKIPWFNVTPQEVEQTCQAMGGTICSTANWKTACAVTPGSGADCTWGYAPFGAACTSSFTATKQCNLGYFDFNTSSAGDQDGLLPTASALLQNCNADWTGLLGNVNPTNKLFDITGNVREITRLNASTYILMGGAFSSQAESGATCDFDFYAVESDFKFFDTGFRCCFTQDPTL